MSKKKVQKKSFLDTLSSVPRNAYIVFGILIFIIYAQCLSFDFTQYDDEGLIRSKELSLANADVIFQKGVFHFTGDIPVEQDIYYRPIQNVVYAFGNLLGGPKPFIHHLISMLLHFAVSCLLYHFLIRIGYRNVTAFFTTVIFIVHPLLVQAIAWIPGLGELLIALFLLLSFIYLDKYVEDKNKNFIPAVLSNLFFFFALLSKESAVGFIPVILVYLFFIHKNKEGIYRKLLFYSGGLIIVTGVWFFLRQHALGAYSSVAGFEIINSLLNNGKLVVYYIGKIFVPVNLSPLQSVLDSPLLPGLICIAILGVSFFMIKEKRNLMLLLFGIVWYLAFLIPTLFVTSSKFEFYSYNHRLYLPFIGFLIVILEIFSLNKKEISKLTGSVVFVFAFVFLILSFNYSKAFKDKYSFYKPIIENSPHSVKAFESLGNIYYVENKCDKALYLFQKAVALKPETHGFYGLVANTYMRCYNDLPKAIEWYHKALAVDSVSKPTANTAISLGNIYYMSYKDNETAKYWFRKAIVIDSTQTYPMGILGNLLSSKEPDSAKYWYQKVLKTDSLSPIACNGMGMLDYKKGNYKEAVYYFRKALIINPTEVVIYKNIFLAYQALNDFENAKKFAEEYKKRGGALTEDMVQYLKGQS